jgi:hypothetical protein
MLLKKTISPLAIVSVCSTILCALTLLFFQDNFQAIVLKLTCFLFYISITLVGNSILISTANRTPASIINIITFVNGSLIVCASLILLDILSFINLWHIVIGISILYITSIQLNLLGWSNNKQTIINKVYFFLILCVNLFLACIFFLKVSHNVLDPFILIAIIISACFFILGNYSASNSQQ